MRSLVALTFATAFLASLSAAEAQQSNSIQGRRDASAAQGLSLQAPASQVFGFALPPPEVDTIEVPTRFSTKIGKPITTQIAPVITGR